MSVWLVSVRIEAPDGITARQRLHDMFDAQPFPIAWGRPKEEPENESVVVGQTEAECDCPGWATKHIFGCPAFRQPEGQVKP